MSRGTRTKLINRITSGLSIRIVSERSTSSPRSSTSAFLEEQNQRTANGSVEGLSSR
jgi:hypothetical protein